MSEPSLLAGFDRPSLAAQQCFRAILAALAEPGSAQTLALPREVPSACEPGIASIGLALLDSSTSFHVCELPGLSDYFRFHTGAVDTEPQNAQWVFSSAANPAMLALIASLNMGSLESPEQASTLVLQLEAAPQDRVNLSLRGPGIQGVKGVPSFGMRPEFWTWRCAARERYPLGLDLLFVFGSQVWALPRSTAIELENRCT